MRREVPAPISVVPRWVLIAALAVVMFAAAGVRTYGIMDPWLQGHIGWSGYRSGTIARNYVRFGYADTRLGAVRNVGPLRPERFTYDEHPYMVYWLTSLSFRVFGIHDWSATLAPVLCSVAGVGLLFLLGLRLFGPGVALLAAGFMVLAPMDAYYGRMVDQEAPTLLFSLLTFYLYAGWAERPTRRGLTAVFVTSTLAALSDFPGLFVTPWLAVYHLLFGSRTAEPNHRSLFSTLRGRWKLSLALGVTSGVLFALWAGYLAAISGSFDILLDRFALRRLSEAPWVFTPQELYRLEFLRVEGLYTPLLAALAALWAGFAVWDVAHHRNLRRHGFMAMLAGFGVTYLVTFQQNAYQHDFVAYYLTPFLCLSAAWAVVRLGRTLFGRRPVLQGALAVVVFVVFAGQAIEALQSFYLPKEAGYVQVARELSQALPTEARVLAAVEDSTFNQWIWYLDRPSFRVTDLAGLTARLPDPANMVFVVDTRLSDTTLELRRYLFAHYPVEARDAFLIFDLRARAEPPASGATTEAPLYHDDFLTLLSSHVPSEAKQPEPSPWARYLYSSPTYWPGGPDLPVQATLYWRCDKTPPAGYTPAVSLRAELDRVYEIGPSASPQMAAWPPEMWRPGDVVRADYFFRISGDQPPTRYALAIAAANENSDPVAVGYVSVLPPVQPAALASTPSPARAQESVPVPGLKFLGYDLPRTEVGADGELALATYWEAEAGLDADYAITAQLAGGETRASEPVALGPTRLMEAGRSYRANLTWRLPEELLSGRYALSLSLRGPTKASLPLGEVQVTSATQAGLARQWPAGSKALEPLGPDEPLKLRFDLRNPRALSLVARFSGHTELDRTRVEVYAVNSGWLWSGHKYLTTWSVPRGRATTFTCAVPGELTGAGSNTLELLVPIPPPAEAHPQGWRGWVDALIPGFWRDPGAAESGAVGLEYVRVLSAHPGQDWEQTMALAQAYAERGMWPEAAREYRAARARGLAPTSAEDLGLFLHVADAVGDAALKSEVENQLAELIPHPASVDLGGQVRFLGWGIGPSASAAQSDAGPARTHLDLYFQALQVPSANYTVWIHATPPDPALLRGPAHDAGFASLDHALKTSGWEAGSVYHDSTQVDLLPGDYAISLGLWRPEDGSRLWRDDGPGEHVIDLGTVEVR